MKRHESLGLPEKPRAIPLDELCAGVEPSGLAPLPVASLDAGTLAACRVLARRYLNPGHGQSIPSHEFDMPKWVFLDFLARSERFLFHGSPRADLIELKPRVAGDNLAGSRQPRVYASSSGLMAAFSAILDRRRFRSPVGISSILSLPNAKAAPSGQERAHIAVDHRVLPKAPWTAGCVYLLPRDAFTPDYVEVRWYRAKPVKPLARIPFKPHEWPLLDQVRRVSLAASIPRFNRSPKGFPWWGDEEIYGPPRQDNSTSAVRAYLQTHLVENVSLATLGLLVDMSPFHLLRVFRAATGLSPLQYQLWLRLELARRFLVDGKSAAASASASGFVDQSHLTRRFQRAYGMTPGQFMAERDSRSNDTCQ